MTREREDKEGVKTRRGEDGDADDAAGNDAGGEG